MGLAGFSSVLVALRGPTNQWIAIDLFRIKGMLGASFAVTFISLFPILLAFFAIDEETKWQMSLIMTAIVLLSASLFVYFSYKKLPLIDKNVVSPKAVWTILLIMFTFAVIALIAAFSYINIASGVFFLGLLLVLGIAVFLVVRFIFVRPKPKD
ncbi:hypothetical protein [Colwellia sp. 12G3]|uniref:hypothetical protein n=1 Tax=Colwellia sp. 12G3 TaxID=2058299 RepID=UPI000C32B624|nr:hypothetical protein [Colwellia sp. 12G3]PKI17568.1 hypothetical protein CXF71_04015 [Colwellia sp. 12G3]